jgi:hypothetical protein
MIHFCPHPPPKADKIKTIMKFPIAPDVPTPPAPQKNPLPPNNYHVYYNGERIMVIAADRMSTRDTGQIFLEFRSSYTPVAIIPASHMVIECKPEPEPSPNIQLNIGPSKL